MRIALVEGFVVEQSLIDFMPCPHGSFPVLQFPRQTAVSLLGSIPFSPGFQPVEQAIQAMALPAPVNLLPALLAFPVPAPSQLPFLLAGDGKIGELILNPATHGFLFASRMARVTSFAAAVMAAISRKATGSLVPYWSKTVAAVHAALTAFV